LESIASSDIFKTENVESDFEELLIPYKEKRCKMSLKRLIFPTNLCAVGDEHEMSSTEQRSQGQWLSYAVFSRWLLL
jgi:hypothetical protein